MIRFANIVAIVVVIGAGVGLYQLKYTTEQVQEEVRRLEAQIASDEAAIKVLKAEWTYLSRPERLERLSERYLALRPTASAQVARNLEDIPFRSDPLAVVAAGDDFRAVTPQLVRGPAARPERPQRIPAPVEAEEKPVLEAQHTPAVVPVTHSPAAHGPRPDLFTRIKMALSEQPDGN
jgi:cell division protein FtsL